MVVSAFRFCAGLGIEVAQSIRVEDADLERVERDVDTKLARFEIPQIEHDLWVLDRKMNDTGIRVDTKLVANAIECDAQVKERLTAEAIKLTGLKNPSSRKQLLEWLA